VTVRGSNQRTAATEREPIKANRVDADSCRAHRVEDDLPARRHRDPDFTVFDLDRHVLIAECVPQADRVIDQILARTRPREADDCGVFGFARDDDDPLTIVEENGTVAEVAPTREIERDIGSEVG